MVTSPAAPSANKSASPRTEGAAACRPPDGSSALPAAAAVPGGCFGETAATGFGGCTRRLGDASLSPSRVYSAPSSSSGSLVDSCRCCAWSSAAALTSANGPSGSRDFFSFCFGEADEPPLSHSFSRRSLLSASSSAISVFFYLM